jgi:anti-sigma B factor antagonist
MKAEIINNILICNPEGRISNDSTSDFEFRLAQLIFEHENLDIILNMENVTSISSNGIAVLISVAQELKSQDRLFSICNPRDLVMKIISILSVDSFIAVYQTVEEAIDAMSQLAVV